MPASLVLAFNRTQCLALGDLLSATACSSKQPYILFSYLGLDMSPFNSFSDGAVGKESICSAGDTGDAGSIPGSGRLPGGGNGNPLQYSFLENSMHKGARATKHARPLFPDPWPPQEEGGALMSQPQGLHLFLPTSGFT